MEERVEEQSRSLDVPRHLECQKKVERVGNLSGENALLWRKRKRKERKIVDKSTRIAVVF